MAQVQANKVDEARIEFDFLKQKLSMARSSPEGENAMYFPPTNPLSQVELDKIDRLLSEAAGISSTIQARN